MPVPTWLRKRDHVLWDTADIIVKRVGEEAYAVKTDTREVIAHGTDHAEVLKYVASSNRKIVVIDELVLGGKEVRFENISKMILEGLNTKIKNGVITLYGDTYDKNKRNTIRNFIFDNVKVRIENGYNNTIENCEFYGGQVAIEFINTKEWSEFNRIINVELFNPSEAGIAFRTPTSGEDSYIHTYMESVRFHIDTDDAAGILVEKGANISDSEFHNMRFWTSAKRADMIRFNGNALHTIIIAKFESFHDAPEALYGINIGSDANWVPRLIAPEIYGKWTSIVYNPHGKWIPGLTLFKESKDIPVGLNGSYGDAVVVLDRARALTGILAPKIRIRWSGTFASEETVTVKIIFRFLDGAETSVEKSASAPSSIWLTDDDLYTLYPSCLPLHAILVQAKTNQSSTSVTVSVDVIGNG